MTTSLEELIAERATLDQRIKELQSEARSQAISKVRALIANHGLAHNDLFSSSSSSKPNAKKSTTNKVAAKYRDAETGNEWSGRGIPPIWLRGKDKKDYLIA